MKKLLGLFLIVILASCGTDKKESKENAVKEPIKLTKEQWFKQIGDVEKKMNENPNEPINSAVANIAIDFYNKYYLNFPDDEKTPDYLYKAGEISSALNYSEPAINFFKVIHDKYPSYKRAPSCLLLQGFIYETQLNDTSKARVIYEQVIQKYPNTQFAIDSKASIDNLGKTPEQLIKEFEAKNKKK